MPDLQDRIYCSEQIHIPPTFPYIMKLYCKAAIRTQPYDLLKWSAAYFRALANGEEPPVKERVEYPPYDSPSGLTPGYIKILINQFGKDPATMISAQTLFRKWSDICLDEYLLVKLIALLGATTTVNWVNFVGVCAGFISKTLTQTMILICDLFTEEPEGGMATVPYDLFVDLYMFLAQMNCGPLTDKEKEDAEAIMGEEDICEVADKIRRGEYEGEVEGEFAYGEGEGEVEMVAEEAETETEKEKKSIEEEEEEEEVSRKAFGEAISEISVEAEEEKQPEKTEEEEKEEREKEDEELRSTAEPDDEPYMSEMSIRKDQESVRSAVSVQEESPATSAFGEEGLLLSVEPTPLKQEENEGEVDETPEVFVEAAPVTEEQKPPVRKIHLEDLEDSIRVKIEEKLAAETESEMGEDDREFEELGSYLLGAAARVLKYTAESLGFKIFRKYMRQDVPGIGPVVDPEQVEKVVEFMDFWSHKQEMMVMPRNIRHWMCPPLDPVPTPQP